MEFSPPCRVNFRECWRDRRIYHRQYLNKKGLSRQNAVNCRAAGNGRHDAGPFRAVLPCAAGKFLFGMRAECIRRALPSTRGAPYLKAMAALFLCGEAPTMPSGPADPCAVALPRATRTAGNFRVKQNRRAVRLTPDRAAVFCEGTGSGDPSERGFMPGPAPFRKLQAPGYGLL